MTPKVTGWIVFIAALGMMAGLLSADVKALHSWAEATTPEFVGVVLSHFGTVTLAFIGGKLIPTSRSAGLRTRQTDTYRTDEDDAA